MQYKIICIDWYKHKMCPQDLIWAFKKLQSYTNSLSNLWLNHRILPIVSTGQKSITSWKTINLIVSIKFSSQISRRRPLFYLPSNNDGNRYFLRSISDSAFTNGKSKIVFNPVVWILLGLVGFLSLKRRQNIYRRDKVEIPGVSQMTHFVLPSFISTLCMYKETRMKIYMEKVYDSIKQKGMKKFFCKSMKQIDHRIF